MTLGLKNLTPVVVHKSTIADTERTSHHGLLNRLNDNLSTNERLILKGELTCR